MYLLLGTQQKICETHTVPNTLLPAGVIIQRLVNDIDLSAVSSSTSSRPPSAAASSGAASSSLGVASSSARKFENGDTVTVFGLKGEPQFNGKRGYVDGFNAESGRYTISLFEPVGDRCELLVKEINLST